MKSALEDYYLSLAFDTLNRFHIAQEHREIMARLPSERASWHAVRHMNEIGRAPENKQHPDHALAQDLARALGRVNCGYDGGQIVDE